MAGSISGYSMEKRYLRPDGTYRWVDMIITNMNPAGGETDNNDHLCILVDIHDKKIAHDALRESERSKEVLLSHIPGVAYRCRYDENWTMLYLSARCRELTGYAPEDMINNSKLSFNDIICEEYRHLLQAEWTRVIEAKTDFKYEYEILTAAGNKKWVIEMAQPVYNQNGRVETLEGIIIDITELKRSAARIQHMADHDYMTDLYSRKYFEEAKQNLEDRGVAPVALIMADINGTRLINDAFGQAEGDMLIKKTAELIKRCCGDDCIIARTGGDEFSILAPCYNAEAADGLIRRIKEECEYCNSLKLRPGVILNLSIGYGIRQTADQTVAETAKEAEEFLNKHKIFDRKSHHSAILSSIMATMYARSFETEAHAVRLSELAKSIGEKMNLTPKQLMDLELLSILHDIGKIGIDDRILNKPGPLTDEEWTIMKKHPEIGYRIAVSVPEFESVADYILCHHERWDGRGYPQGFRGEEIPLLSRIIAVADAYDAMTEDRVYRKGMPHEEALEEIRKNAGTQFDPLAAELFLQSR
jgi:diguanylate cyclase (GGDEF)-like protein/PAS domain S-box-containing protein